MIGNDDGAFAKNVKAVGFPWAGRYIGSSERFPAGYRSLGIRSIEYMCALDEALVA